MWLNNSVTLGAFRRAVLSLSSELILADREFPTVQPPRRFQDESGNLGDKSKGKDLKR
jgi:hypothetical protein